ncbi:phytanoyl-CoA dioxygenase family protein [Nitrosospira multiformis]|nr:phytanoyl-CoA dioxygenase family protein [Nitrosospira multiformis]
MQVTVDQYRHFRSQGYLVMENVLSIDELEELDRHADDIIAGRLPLQRKEMPLRDTTADSGTTCQGLDLAPANLSAREREGYFVRMHMLHRVHALHERMLLHPRVLDVVEVLIGPDILALSTMFFFKPPGKAGQGWHQDSFYLPTYPDTLCGVWIAVEDCDAENGALQIAAGSCVEPVYPPAEGYGFGDELISGIQRIRGASEEDATCDLADVAAQYDIRRIEMRAGSAVFFSGHALHRSTANKTTDRSRRSFAAHYCNARSFVRWGSDQIGDDVHAAPIIDVRTGMTNGSHILARGTTHLPFGLPVFGTPCAASKAHV